MIQVLREAKQCPAWVQERLTRVGGRNIHGGPNFRLVWGWTRLTWLCGKFEDRDDAGDLIQICYEDRLVPKHLPLNRWHLEKWMPAEFYGSPEQWAESTWCVEDGRGFFELGPYPNHGDYEHVKTIEGDHGEYLEIRPALVELIVKVVVRSRILVNQDKHMALQALRDREAAVEAAWEKFADDVLDDAARAFGLNTPRIVVPANI